MIGHHGTNKDNAQSIIRTGFFKSKGYQWFGDGVYFFDDDQKEAFYWAKKVKKFETNYAVLKSNINVCNPLNLHKATEWEEFLKTKKMLQENKDKSFFKNKKITDGYTVEFICKQIYKSTGKPVDVVICGCRIPAYDGATKITGIPRMQVQLCVRELDSITSIQIVEEAS